MNCIKCNKEILQNANFCKFCGSSQAISSTPLNNNSNKKDKPRKIMPIVATLVALSIGVSAGVFYYLNHEKLTVGTAFINTFDKISDNISDISNQIPLFEFLDDLDENQYEINGSYANLIKITGQLDQKLGLLSIEPSIFGVKGHFTSSNDHITFGLNALNLNFGYPKTSNQSNKSFSNSLNFFESFIFDFSKTINPEFLGEYTINGTDVSGYEIELSKENVQKSLSAVVDLYINDQNFKNSFDIYKETIPLIDEIMIEQGYSNYTFDDFSVVLNNNVNDFSEVVDEFLNPAIVYTFDNTIVRMEFPKIKSFIDIDTNDKVYLSLSTEINDKYTELVSFDMGISNNILNISLNSAGQTIGLSYNFSTSSDNLIIKNINKTYVLDLVVNDGLSLNYDDFLKGFTLDMKKTTLSENWFSQDTNYKEYNSNDIENLLNLLN